MRARNNRYEVRSPDFQRQRANYPMLSTSTFAYMGNFLYKKNFEMLLLLLLLVNNQKNFCYYYEMWEIGQDITECNADLDHLARAESPLRRASEQLFEGLPFDMVNDDVPVFGLGVLVMHTWEMCVTHLREQGESALE